MVTRTVEVPSERLVGWVERYTATHPAASACPAEGGLLLSSPSNQATAELVPLLTFTSAIEAAPGPAGRDLVVELAAHADRPLRVAIILIRRGGYAVGVAQGDRVIVSKVGTRYVQSRTAAGGWSQQRFARRRDGQARDLLGAAAEAWRGLTPTGGAAYDALVTGGDRALCERLLEDPRLPKMAVARHLEVPDPRQVVLVDAARRTQAILVTVHEP